MSVASLTRHQGVVFILLTVSFQAHTTGPACQEAKDALRGLRKGQLDSAAALGPGTAFDR